MRTLMPLAARTPAAVFAKMSLFRRKRYQPIGFTLCQIVRAILALAQGLGLCVVAEGVEAAGQRDALKAMGCQMAQGFLIARPMSPTQVRQAYFDAPDQAAAEAAALQVLPGADAHAQPVAEVPEAEMPQALRAVEPPPSLEPPAS